jgi:hypothetical protein
MVSCKKLDAEFSLPAHHTQPSCPSHSAFLSITLSLAHALSFFICFGAHSIRDKKASFTLRCDRFLLLLCGAVNTHVAPLVYVRSNALDLFCRFSVFIFV